MVSACAPQQEPTAADPRSDVLDAAGVDAEFGVQAFALTTPTLTLVTPAPGTALPVGAAGAKTSVDVTYTVANYALGQVRCYTDGTFVGLGTATTYKFINLGKGLHTLSCVLAANTGTEETAASARLVLQVKVLEPCTNAGDCNDSNACSQDACVDGQCVFAAVPNCCGSKFDCSAGETCLNPNTANSQCTACTGNADCNDNESCTTDKCDLTGAKGVCSNIKSDKECCSKAGDLCDDGKACTVDKCDTAKGQCTHVKPDGVCCSDSDCVLTDPCLVASCVDNECRTGPDKFKPDCCSDTFKPTCDDSNYCTIDACDVVQSGGWKSCSHKMDPNKPGCCNIGNGAANDQCDDGQPCTWDYCNEYKCVNLKTAECCETTLDCDDNNPCTADKCTILSGDKAGTCSKTKVDGCCISVADCQDNKFCTIDACNYSAFSCKNDKPDPSCCDTDEECNDGKFCTVKVCVNHQCLFGPDKFKPGCCDGNADCNDGKACTIDTCETASHQCLYASNGDPTCCNGPEDCDDGDCTTVDYCDGFNKCKHGPAPDKCKADIDCDDGNPCSADKCTVVNGCGSCEHAEVPAAQCCQADYGCNDNNPCTTDTCDVNTGKCSHGTVSNCCKDDVDAQTACNDNNACTIEYCVGNQCRNTVPKNGCCASNADCNDADTCTNDTCANIVAGKGACQYAAISGCTAGCDPGWSADKLSDGNVCTVDQCVLVNGTYKVSHTPIPSCCIDKFDCNDSLPCTYDYCIFNECVHQNSEGGATLCCSKETEATDCGYLNSPCATGQCVDQPDGAKKCQAVEKPVCTVNLSYCQDFEGSGTVKQLGWNPTDLNGTASTNWGISTDGGLGPDKFARLTWTPTKNNFHTCLQSPVIQAAGAQAITVQFDREFTPALGDATLTIRGSLDGEVVDWSKSVIIDGPLTAASQLGPDTLSIKLPPELSGSNGLRLAFCVASTSTLNIDQFAVDNVCIAKGTAPSAAKCPPNQTVGVGAKISVPIKVTDPDVGDIVSFQVLQAPSFVKASSALYYWLDGTWNTNVTMEPLSLDDVGDHEVVIRYTDGFLFGTCTFKVTVTYSGGYLIYKPTEVPAAQAQTLKNALAKKGQFGQITTDLSLYTDLSKFYGIFVLLGVYPDNHVLLEGEISGLKAYLSGGGKLYLEGGDTFMFDKATTLHPFFKIKGILESSPAGVTGPLKGSHVFADPSTTPATSYAFGYSQDWTFNNLNDQIEGQIAVAKTKNILRNDGVEKYWVAVGHDNPTAKYRTIGSSVLFSGIEALGGGTQDLFLDRILSFWANGFADCTKDTDCNDDNACTTDTCTAGACGYANACLCSAQSDAKCGDSFTKLVTNGGGATQATANYSCDGANTFLGKEVAYSYVSSTSKPVTLTLANVTNPKAKLFVLKASAKGCDPSGCIAQTAVTSGGATVTFAATANVQYFIVIDVPGATDSAQFDLAIACAAGEDCKNGLDDNGNGKIDCADKTSCCGDSACLGETCNGIDDNCDGTIDEGCDDDGDGWCDNAMNTVGKPPVCPSGTGDCNDADGTISPGQAELCGNSKDDNCSGAQNEENASGCSNYFTDLDGDAFGAGGSKCLCAPSGSFKATKAGDCNDAKALVNPQVPENCSTSDDDNCNGNTNDVDATGCKNFYTDLDGDLFGTSPFKCQCVASGVVSATKPGDCVDTNAGINPSVAEICNGLDDNCNGTSDETCDDDGDGYCDANITYSPQASTTDICNKATDGGVLTLACPAGGVISAIKFAEYGTVTGSCPSFAKGGCDAANEIAYMSSQCLGKAVCNTSNWQLSLGDPCGGVVKTMAVVATCSVSGSGPLAVCPKGAGDSDDTDPAINPAGAEICDGKDNNSNGQIDEGCDDDKDGFCDASMFTLGKPTTCPSGGGDCADTDPKINPGAAEDCGTPSVDENCNGSFNDLNALGCTPLFFDGDLDKWGTNASKCLCGAIGQYNAINPGDCNDDNKNINPAATELCDDIDNDCDKVVDNGCDDDGDGFCDIGVTLIGTPAVCVNGNGDCNDADAQVNPAKAEVCGDGKDNNCNGNSNDIGAIGCSQFYTDQDGDTYGTGTKTCLCQASGAISATNNADCADTDASVNPAVAEKCDGKDNNCNGVIDDGCDDDKDGYCDAALSLVGSPSICPYGGGDCDDNSATVYKGKTAETCDGKDDDCNGSTDNGCDDDKDGYCDAGMAVANPAPAICAKGSGDCDDLDNTVMPGAKEVCGNSKDDNCNGSQNDENSIGCSTLYYDGDADTYGLDISKCFCTATGKFTAKQNGDCDDTTSAVAPGVGEKCDGIDNDCDGELDEAGATGCSTFYYDEDKDGYGLSLTKCLCAAGSPFTASQAGDCNDTNAQMTPGKTEVCDNLDNNCNTQVDENCNADGDKYCAASKTVVGLPAVCPLGGGDCNDTVTAINPSANEVCNDKDDNCNGTTDEGCDNDGDGYCDSNMTTVANNTLTAINDDFEAGASGWSATTTSTCGPIGKILGGVNVFGAGAKTAKTVNLSSHSLITIEFDFIKIDSWDGESGQLWLDGKLVWSKAYTVSMGTQACGSAGGWNELKDRITLTVPHTAATAKIEFTTTLDQTPDDESWGVDNVLVTVSADYPATCPKGAADCNDTDAAINPGAKEVCSNTVDENCSGSTNDPDALGCKTYYVDFDGDGFGKGGTAFQKVIINEFRRSGNFTNDEYIELLVTTDLLASDVDALYFGDSSSTGAAKFSAYRTKLAALGLTQIKAGTLIAIGGSTLTQDLTYNPAGGDWNLTLLVGSANVTVTTAGGDFAADDVVWVDNSNTGTTSIDAIRWGGATGTLGAAAKVALASLPANGTTGVVAFTSDIGGLNQPSNYQVNGTASVGQPNGGTNSTFVQWLRTTSLGGNSQCLCSPDSTYKVTKAGDCNDANLNVFSGATELCDGIDNNCSGVVDEGCDNDSDGYCDLNMITVGTPPLCPFGGGDCDDTKGAVNPGATESCSDGVDTNCDGDLNSTGGAGCIDFFYDGDGDGVGASVKQCMCSAKAPYTANIGGDCDDTKAAVKPGVQEDCATPYDDNCNGDIADSGALNCLSFYADVDKDGYGSGSAVCKCVASGNLIATVAGDCNDADGNINPGKTEICDGKDNNCNASGAAAVESNTNTGTNNSLTNYIAQEVTFAQGGALARLEVYINAPNAQNVTLYVFKGNRPASLTGQVETIGPVAVSATGTYSKYTFTSVTKPSIAAGEQWVFIWKASSTGTTIQESAGNVYTKGGAFYAATSPFTWTGLGSGGGTNVAGTTDVTFTAYLVTTGASVDEGCNDDGDGYCDANMDTATPAPATCAKGGGDCNDASAAVNKDAVEVCDNLDNNCNGKTDEECDADLDGWCSAAKTVVGTPAICSAGKNDCDDGNKNVYPGKSEFCDDADNNCNGSTDEGCDADNDDYCTSAMATLGAPAICPKGGNDCADSDPAVNPGVVEACDGKDNNCAGGADESCNDADKDGYCNGNVGCATCGNGIDGDYIAASNTTLPAKAYNFKNFIINAGVTVTITGNSEPLAIRASGKVEIKGALVLNGGAGSDVTNNANGCLGGQSTPGQSYAFGSIGGYGVYSDPNAVYAGQGAGGGKPGIYNWNGTGCGSGGGGGGHSGNGVSVSGGGAGGVAYATIDQDKLIGGSGGGAGGYGSAYNATGAGGGGGGGAVRIDSPDVVISGTISALGGQGGGQYSDCDGGAGGGGAGGSIWVRGNSVNVTGGTLVATGGAAGVLQNSANCGTAGAAGAAGRVRIDANNLVSTGSTAPTYSTGSKDGLGSAVSSGCPKGGGDCNDSNPAINPGASEICSTPGDDNCDGVVNAVGASGCSNWYADADLDGYGGGTGKCQCYQTSEFPAAQGGDCKDDDNTVGPGQPELCDGLDNDCKSGTDNGCDDDGDTYCDANMPMKDTALCSGSLSTCKTGLQWPPLKLPTLTMETYSHGGGYHPYYKEYWYPQWASATIYRYNEQRQYIGTLNAGQGEIMGLHGDTQSADYFTANWGYYTVTRRSGASTKWSYSLGYYAGAVYADDNFVYAMRVDTFTITKLNKTTGQLIENINLTGASNGNWVYGSLAVVGNYAYVGRGDGTIHAFDMSTKAQIGTYSTGVNIYNATFDGGTMCVSPNSNQVYCFTMYGKVCEQVCTNGLMWPPKTASVVNMQTYSHGGGYSPKYKEYWYPSWNGSTIYRFNSTYQQIGSFNSGQNNMMQVWGDTDGTYYTANWGENTITKKSDMGSATLWSYNLGTTAGGVTADANFVYAMGADAMKVVKLNKANGQFIESIVLSGGGSESINGGLAIANNQLLVGRSSGMVYRYDVSKAADGPVWPAVYTGTRSMNTYSHGGGYSPKYKEYWYPNWAGSTIYRFNTQFQQVGSFNSGTGEIMQLWGDADGTYYTANWGQGAIYKWGDMNATQLWKTNIGQTMGGVTADDNYVYAMANSGATVWRLNKSTGAIIDSFNLSGGYFSGLDGGLAVVDGKLYAGRENAVVYRYDLVTKQLDGQFNTATNIYNMAFNGEEYCISNNGSTVWCYQLKGKTAKLIDQFQTATNINNMAFNGTQYCISANSSTVYCYTATGEVCKKGNDCDDTQASVKPGLNEVCDGQDNNCDTLIDDGCDDDNDNYCDKDMSVVGTPPTCTAGGGDCNDTSSSMNPAPSTKENCGTAQDDNCDGATDQLGALGCTNFYYDNDGDGQGTTSFECRCTANGKFAALASGDCNDNDAAINSGTGVEKAQKGVYRGSPISMETYSHGGGFSPASNEYWYPQWAGGTVYRYNSNFQQVGSFGSGLGEMMQLWGDKDGSYYTANWGYQVIRKYTGMGSNVAWSFNIGSTAGGVTVDANYVYAMRSSGMTVWVLDKATGQQVKTLNLSGGSDGTVYGSMAVYGNVLFVGRDSGWVYMYDSSSGLLIDQFQTATNIYNMAFNGTEYCISANSSTVYCYKIVGNTLPTESCDGKDNNCNGVTDETCDQDKDGYCDANLKVTNTAGCPKSQIKSTNCLAVQNPPTYKGSIVSMNTRSHGGGYSPKYNEYWYPEWSGTTIYRYNSSYQYIGAFNSGQNQMMQLWGDTDGTYYTANWGYATITKKSDMGATTLWTWNGPTTMGGVTADSTYVYAMPVSSMTVYVLNKTNGALVKTFNLNGGSNPTLYGGLAAVNGSLYMGVYTGVVYRYDITNGQLLDQFSVATNINNMAFNGKEYCISANDSNVYCYNLLTDKCNFGDDCDDKDKTVNPGAAEMCDSKDNNCDKAADEGCDDDGDGYCDKDMIVVGSPAVDPGTYIGNVITMETYSHGGGYSPKYQEYWYPQWAGGTIYRYNKNFQQVGSFGSGLGEIMQLWGDTDGTYYTANWGYSTIRKWSDMGSTQLWSFNIGTTAGGVAADSQYVYAMRVDGMTVWVLDKATGAQIKTLNLNGGGNTTLYGGLAVTSKYLFVGRYDGNVYYYDKTNGNYVGQFKTAPQINNMAYNGKDYCVSANNNQVYCYTIETGGCPKGGGDCKDTAATVNPGGTEVCDGQDNNCNAQTDEAGSQGCSTFYYDGDQDGVGSSSSQCLCESAKQYKVVSTPATWVQAQADCKNWGGNLTTIESSGINTFVRDTANAAGVTGNIWLGLSDAAVENSYVWADGASMSYSNWDTGEPAGEFFTGTTVLSQTQQQQLNAWDGNPNQKWTLCYRGTQDGFNSNTFHNKCDSKSQTLVVLRETNGNVFGGFNSSTWAGGGSYYSPGGTWLYTFKNNYKANWGGQCAGQSYGTYNHPSYGPTWGGGHDLHVDSSMKSGYTYFGYSYSCPVGSCGTGACQSYLASQYSGWQLNEVEVFYKDGTAGGIANDEDYVLMKGSAKWADVAPSTTAAYVCARTNSLFTAKTTGDCNDACATCTPGKPELCDGNDNNCNSSIDEGCDDDNDDYCDAGLVTVGTAPTCTKGGGDCNDANASVKPGGLESCNNVDDNCNSVTDENSSENCPTNTNALYKCVAGSCQVTGCATGFYDINGSWSDGCECNGNDNNEPNDACSQATVMDTALYDSGKTAGIEGIVMGTDVDWFSVYAADTGDGGSGACDKFNMRVLMTKNPGGVAFDVWRGSCPAGGTNAVCCNSTDFNWFTNFKGSAGPGPYSDYWSEWGECPCQTGNYFDQSNYSWNMGPGNGGPYCMNFNSGGVCIPSGFYYTQCQDNSAWFYVKVYRNAPPTVCGKYKLEFSNGLYGQPGTGNGYVP
jgi:hypothetical protein